MDGQRFDLWTRSLRASGLSRRTLTKTVIGGMLAAIPASVVREGIAAKCVKPGKRCKSKQGKQKCCGGATCRGTRCKCRRGREACRKRCCVLGATCLAGKCQRCDVCARGCPFTTVQAAVDAAAPGATIRLCPGSYAGSVTIGKSLVLAGAARTVLDGNNLVRVLDIQANTTVVVQELTVARGRSTGHGGGIRNAGSLTLAGVNVAGNAVVHGGGGGAGPVGGGILNDHRLTLIGGSVTGNSADGGGGGIFTGATATTTIEGGATVENNTPDNCLTAPGGMLNGTCPPP